MHLDRTRLIRDQSRYMNSVRLYAQQWHIALGPFYCLQLSSETWVMKKGYVFLKWSLLPHRVSVFKSVCTIMFFGIKSTKQDSYLLCFEVVLCASQIILIASDNLCTIMQQLMYKSYVQIDRLYFWYNLTIDIDVTQSYYRATYCMSIFSSDNFRQMREIVKIG